MKHVSRCLLSISEGESGASPPPTPSGDDIAAKLERLAPLLRSLIRQNAGPALLRFESEEDLVQGTMAEVLRCANQMDWRGEEAFIAWVATITKRFVMGRRDYWFALKRNPGALLRLTLTGFAGQRVERPELAASQLGPSTFAFRREQLVMITKAIELLLPRDREIVTWASHGLTVTEMAARIGTSVEAAEKARTRALERLRKSFQLVSQGPCNTKTQRNTSAE